MNQARKIFKESMGRNPKYNYDHIFLKGIEESISIIKKQGYSEGILEDVGRVLKKHGANVIITGVVLNFFRKLFGSSSYKKEGLIIKPTSVKTKQGYPKRIFFLYDDGRLVYSHESKRIVEEKKKELEEAKPQKKLTSYEKMKKLYQGEKTMEEGIILYNGDNIEVEFSPSGKKAMDNKGNEYIQQNGEWVKNEEEFEESFSPKEEQRMKDFIDKRYPKADQIYKTHMLNVIRNKQRDAWRRESVGDQALEKGKKVEKEHKPTYDVLKNYIEENGDLPPAEEFYGMIAQDHLNEDRDYYEYLEEMEKEMKSKSEGLKENPAAIVQAIVIAQQVLTLLNSLSQLIKNTGEIGDKLANEIKGLVDKVKTWVTMFKKQPKEESFKNAKMHLISIKESMVIINSFQEKSGDLMKLVGKTKDDDLTNTDAKAIGKKVAEMKGKKLKSYLGMIKALGGYYGGKGKGAKRLDQLRKLMMDAYDKSKPKKETIENKNISTVDLIPIENGYYYIKETDGIYKKGKGQNFNFIGNLKLRTKLVDKEFNHKKIVDEDMDKFRNFLKKAKKEAIHERSNEEVWYEWVATTDPEDLDELREIAKTLHRNNKVSTMRLGEFKDMNGQEIKDSLLDLLSSAESGLNTSNTGSLVGQKLAGQKEEGKLIDTQKDDNVTVEVRLIPKGYKMETFNKKGKKIFTIKGKDKKKLEESIKEHIDNNRKLYI